MSTREENRRAMPQCSAWVDALRALFGPVRVVYASENGIERGERSGPGVIPVLPLKPLKK